MPPFPFCSASSRTAKPSSPLPCRLSRRLAVFGHARFATLKCSPRSDSGQCCGLADTRPVREHLQMTTELVLGLQIYLRRCAACHPVLITEVRHGRRRERDLQWFLSADHRVEASAGVRDPAGADRVGMARCNTGNAFRDICAEAIGLYKPTTTVTSGPSGIGTSKSSTSHSTVTTTTPPPTPPPTTAEYKDVILPSLILFLSSLPSYLDHAGYRTGFVLRQRNFPYHFLSLTSLQ